MTIQYPEQEFGHSLVDYTNYDFSSAPLFKTKASAESYQAEQLVQDEVIVRSWGVQDMKAGDWVLYKPSSDGSLKKSGVKKAAFDATYVEVEPGRYQKQAYIRAIRIDEPFQFVGVDSDQPEVAPAGAYLVLNCDRNQNPIIINGRRDIFFYKERDLLGSFEEVTLR